MDMKKMDEYFNELFALCDEVNELIQNAKLTMQEMKEMIKDVKTEM